MCISVHFICTLLLIVPLIFFVMSISAAGTLVCSVILNMIAFHLCQSHIIHLSIYLIKFWEVMLITACLMSESLREKNEHLHSVQCLCSERLEKSLLFSCYCKVQQIFFLEQFSLLLLEIFAKSMLLRQLKNISQRNMEI